MANLPPVAQWVPVYQLEVTDLVLGGAGQVANSQAQALVDRTEYLYNNLSGMNNVTTDNVILQGQINTSTGVQDFLRVGVNSLTLAANSSYPFIFSVFNGYSGAVPQIIVRRLETNVTFDTTLLPNGDYYIFAEIDSSNNIILGTFPINATYISSILYNDNSVLYYRKDLNRFESTDAVGVITIRKMVMIGTFNKAGSSNTILRTFNFRKPFYNYSISVGSMQWFTGEKEPIGGWIRCDGRLLLRSQYRELFEEIGTIYGTTDITNFRVPDTRGRFNRDLDSGAGIDTGRIIGTSQQDAIKSHTHTVGPGSASPSLVSTTTGTANLQISSGGTNNFTDNQGDNTINATGGTETVPKNIAFVQYIKF